MDDHIAEKRQARQSAQDFLAANPAINTVALSGIVVDRAGVAHGGPAELSAVEAGISNWLFREWRAVADLDTGDSWDIMCHMLYGALQSTLNHGSVDAYAAYSFLADIARARRHQAIVDAIGFGSNE